MSAPPRALRVTILGAWDELSMRLNRALFLMALICSMSARTLTPLVTLLERA